MTEIKDVIKKASQLGPGAGGLVEEYFDKKKAGENPDPGNALDAVRKEYYEEKRKGKKEACLEFSEKIKSADFIWEQLEKIEKLKLFEKYLLLYNLYITVEREIIGIEAYNQIIIRLSNVVSDLSEIAYKKGMEKEGNILRAKGIILSQGILLG